MTPEAAPTVAGLPFVGRDAALAEFDGVLAAAGHGRGALVLIRGEAGIGKTTLAARAADRAAARGIATRFGACWLEGGAPAFWPWAQLLDAHARDLDGDELQRLAGDAAPALATISSALATRLPAAEARPGAQDPATARFALLAAVAGFWLRAADRAPLLLALEDLHWADVASVLLLAQLGSELADHPLVVVGTLRGDEVADDRLRDALAELNRASPLVLELGGLSAGALAELVRHADLAPDRALVDALAARTGGNPLFVTELLRMLGAAGASGAAPSRVLASEVPRHVSEVVHRRVARLPAPVAELLQAAAVIGPEGDDAVLAGTAALDLDRCLERMDVAIAAGLLAEAGAGRWRFTHALLRDALYGALATSVRRTLHDRAGRALEPYGAPPADLARHALGALPLGDRGRAVELAAQAGRAAMAALAYEEAAAHLAAALGALPHNAPPRADLLLALGEAQRSSGDTEAARETFLAAADAAGDDAELLATAALGFADPAADLGLAFRAMGDRTPALLDRALQAVGPADTPVRVELLARLSAELYFSPEPERSRTLAEEAVATARRVGDPRALVAALAVHHDGYVVGHADAATALRGSAELLQLARASGDRRTLLAARRARVFDLLVAGDLAGVDAETEAFRLLAEELRLPTYRWWTALWRAMRALLEGRHADAERLALEAQAMGARPFVRLADLNAMFLVFFLRREQGRLDELEPVMRPFAAQQADIPSTAVGVAFGLAELGQHDEAAGMLARLAADDYARLHDRNWPVSWFQLARVAALVGDRARAERLYEFGRPLAGQCVMVSVATVCLGAAELGLAWLAAALGRAEDADTHFTRAEATNARLGARGWLAQARADPAPLLAGPDPERARELAALARDAAAALGLAPVLASAEAVLARVGQGTAGGGAAFGRDGETWVLEYAGASARLRHAKGLADIAWLLGRPGEPVPAAELLARQDPGAEQKPVASADDVLDPRARREVRERLAELEADVEAADAAHDPERAALARAERDELVAALASAVGLGGRARRLGDESERIRKTVTARIRNSIRRIEREHAPLARHLERSIDTGLWCVYRPEQPVRWRL